MSQRICHLIFISLFSLSLSSCVKGNEFEKNVSIPSHQWNFANKPKFEFYISDTNAKYNMYFLMRHTDSYPYANIWLNIKTKQPNEVSFNQTRVEIPLAQTDGKWLGRGIGEIWEHKLSLSNNGYIHYSKAGKYEIVLEQIMRTNPLPEVMSVGIHLEKVKK
jgi:gliding motility-associated lipoprotein GldH